jgi:hypothetical protein
MLKAIRFRKWRIPNTLAIAAALLLLVTSLADIQRPADRAPGGSAFANSQGQAVTQPADAPEPLAHTSTRQTQKFRVNLFMFRH